MDEMTLRIVTKLLTATVAISTCALAPTTALAATGPQLPESTVHSAAYRVSAEIPDGGSGEASSDSGASQTTPGDDSSQTAPGGEPGSPTPDNDSSEDTEGGISNETAAGDESSALAPGDEPTESTPGSDSNAATPGNEPSEGTEGAEPGETTPSDSSSGDGLTSGLSGPDIDPGFKRPDVGSGDDGANPATPSEDGSAQPPPPKVFDGGLKFNPPVKPPTVMYPPPAPDRLPDRLDLGVPGEGVDGSQVPRDGEQPDMPPEGDTLIGDLPQYPWGGDDYVAVYEGWRDYTKYLPTSVLSEHYLGVDALALGLTWATQTLYYPGYGLAKGVEWTVGEIESAGAWIGDQAESAWDWITDGFGGFFGGSYVPTGGAGAALTGLGGAVADAGEAVVDGVGDALDTVEDSMPWNW
ncbi:hypothetical protein MOQ72_05160 [Saccharopolyspora sp. K220]|uniref:hypothetical protein n=1 Tax=Saccharopolyspora soli TaxID=2926618 RepID=UPI001F57BC73|nr:hypothetical protein [Saccharopolyspora soli]MCI2416805.1 hypothetical protein [Saccharopolyspora soli]